MEQIQSHTRRRIPLTLNKVVDTINPIIRRWGNYFWKADVHVFLWLQEDEQTRFPGFLVRPVDWSGAAFLLLWIGFSFKYRL
jgi:hypothetical protein